MTNVGFATLGVVPSARGFGAALTAGARPAFGAIGRSGGATLASGLLTAAARFVGPLAIASAALAVGGYLKGAISEASDLGESVNALNVVFGDNSEAVQSLGREAAQALGLSNVQFNSLAVQFSNMAKNIAGPGGDVVGTLEQITGRASDFASVMNLDVAEAAALFQSGLAGETEPLRRYGIDLSAATVASYAYANGIAAAGTELTEAQKLQARYGLLMESTAVTAGDFANTSDQLANSQRRLGASWANITATIGSAFLPAVARVASWLADNLQPAFAHLRPALDQFAAALSGQIGPLLKLWLETTPIMALLRTLRPHLPALGRLVGELVSVIAVLWSDQLAALIPLLGDLYRVLGGVLGDALPYIAEYISAFAAALADTLPAYGDAAASLLPLVLALFSVALQSDLLTIYLDYASSVLALIAPALLPLVDLLASVLIPAVRALQPVVESVFAALGPIIEAQIGILLSVVQVVTGILSGDWSAAWDGCRQLLAAVWDLILAALRGALSVTVAAISATLTAIGSAWSTLWSWVVDLAHAMWSGAVAAISAGLANALGFFRGIRSAVLGAFANAGDWMLDAGRNIVEGLVEGLASAGEWIARAFLWPIQEAVGGVLDFLGIHSPSRTFFGIGAAAAEDSALAVARSEAPASPSAPPGGASLALARAARRGTRRVDFDYTQEAGRGFPSEREARTAATRSLSGMLQSLPA